MSKEKLQETIQRQEQELGILRNRLTELTDYRRLSSQIEDWHRRWVDKCRQLEQLKGEHALSKLKAINILSQSMEVGDEDY